MQDALELVLPKGDPNGIKIINLHGWAGKCFIFSRAELRSLKDRPEMAGPGIYFLFGEENHTDDELVYIGESSNCLYRLTSHDSEKDFWNQAAVFLNPPDRNYLESISTRIAKESKRYVVKNANQPHEEDQSEFDKIRNQKYFEGMRKILNVFGYPVLDSVAESISDKKVYYLKAEGVDARAQLLDDGSLNVLSGSLARKRETRSFVGWSKGARDKFIADGTFVDNGDDISYRYTRDVLFKSPSAAAATTTGRAINGWTSWRDKEDNGGNTLDENLRG